MSRAHIHEYDGCDWSHAGKNVPGDLHIHECCGGPGSCTQVIAGLGTDCPGADGPHMIASLTRAGLRPAAVASLLRDAAAGPEVRYGWERKPGTPS